MTVTVREPAGAPVERIAVRARLIHPVHRINDRTFDVTRSGTGLYAGTTEGVVAGAHDLDLSLFVEPLGDGRARMDLRRRRHQVRRLHAGDRAGLSTAFPASNRRGSISPKRLTVEWREDAITPQRIIDRLDELGFRAHPFSPQSRRGRGGPRGALPAALPRRRRLRHEHHAAVGVGVVRQRSDITPERAISSTGCRR
jgi:hypothetical protein